jgi:hypothetical protein
MEAYENPVYDLEPRIEVVPWFRRYDLVFKRVEATFLRLLIQSHTNESNSNVNDCNITVWISEPRIIKNHIEHLAVM